LTEELSGSSKPQSPWLSDTAILAYIALATVIVHWITGHHYDFTAMNWPR